MYHYYDYKWTFYLCEENAKCTGELIASELTMLTKLKERNNLPRKSTKLNGSEI